MPPPISRRSLLKTGAALAGTAATAAALPWLFPPKEAAFDRNASGWQKNGAADCPPLNESIQADVAIIGGGYTGLSTALHLAQIDPSQKIVILEAVQPGNGASGRNGGMVLPQFGESMFETPEDYASLSKDNAITVKAVRSMQDLAAKDGQYCGLKLDGYCLAILDEDDLDYYRNYVTQTSKEGMKFELWDADTAEEELGSPEFAGAIYDPNGGQIHPMRWLQVLWRAAEKSGAIIYGESPVTAIDEGQTIRLEVANGRGQVEAKAIVLATNAYTPALGYFKSRLMPVHAPTGITAPLSKQQLASMGWNSRLPFFDTRNFLYHLVLTDNNRIVVGGGSARYELGGDLIYRGDPVADAKMMLDDLARLYPNLKGLRFEKVWSGVMGITFDGGEGLGVTGEHDNIYYALGYNGHGIVMSYLFGEALANLYHGKPHPLQDTGHVNRSLAYIPPDPYRWIGATANLAYLRRQDQDFFK